MIDLLADLGSLYVTGRLTHTRISWWRLALAGLAGSTVSLGIIVFRLYGIPVNYVVSVLALEILMVGIAYQIYSVRHLIVLCGCQLLTAFGLHGVLTVLMQFVHTGYLLILFLGILILWLLNHGYSLYRQEERNEALNVRGILYWKDAAVTGRGFVDTGNTLRDPISLQPVIIVEGSFICPILPEPYQEMVKQYVKDGRIDYDTIAAQNLHKIRVIPYRTISEEEGSLLGIQCRRLVLIHNGKTFEFSPVVIGISRTVICKGREYQMLLPNNIV